MTEDHKNDKAHEGREVIYSCLSRLFMEPPSGTACDMLKTLISGMADMAGGSAETAEGLEGIKRVMEERDKTSGEKRKEYDLDLLRCYTRIFCLTDSVPTSESYYTSVDKLVMQESRDDALRLYKNAGFSMDIDSNEPEDHIGCELMFMSYLSKAAKKAAASGDFRRLADVLEFQKNFIDGHLLNWLDKFVGRVSSYECAGSLYGSIGKLTLGYIKEDRAFLGE